MIAWIAGPPTFNLAITRSTRVAPASFGLTPVRVNFESTNQVLASSTPSISLRSSAVLAMWRAAKRAADSWKARIVRVLTPLAPVA